MARFHETRPSPDATTVRPSLLFISPLEPKENGAGVERRAWSHLEALARVSNVDLLVAVPAAQKIHQTSAWSRLRAICRNTVLVLLETGKAKPSSALALLLRRLLRFGRSRFRLAADTISRLGALNGMTYDVVFCFRVRSYMVWEHLRALGIHAKRLYVDFDDIESLAAWRRVPFLRQSAGTAMTIVEAMESLEFRFLERKILRQADAVSICSAIDRERLQNRTPRARVDVLPNSYPLMDQLSPRPPGPRPMEILFVGAMGYRPNEEGILWFHREVLPRIREQYPGEVRLCIVGRQPGASVLALSKDPSITVTGGVESVTPYYERADIVIVPVRFGSGTRIKILEAMSLGRPVVSTPVGAEGLDLEPEKDLLIADTAAEFAEACIELCRNEEKWRSLVENGRCRIAALYDRARVQEQLLGLIFPEMLLSSTSPQTSGEQSAVAI